MIRLKTFYLVFYFNNTFESSSHSHINRVIAISLQIYKNDEIY